MIAAIAAEAIEFSGWLRFCTNTRPLRWPLQFAREARWGAERVLMLADGAGPRFAARSLALAQHRAAIDAVVSIGFCGALDPAMALNDIFVAKNLRTADRIAPLEQPRSMPKAHTGTLLSVDRFIRTAQEKRALFNQGSHAVEMEAAGIEFSGPLYAIRVVSDTAEEDFALDFNRYRDEEGRFRKWRIALAGIASPGSVIRMARRAHHASRALGEFLHQCRL